MRPFLLVAADFIKTGGMDRANYALADYLARHGHEVHLVAHQVGTGLLQYENVAWHRVARPGGHDALGWGRLQRSGRKWAARMQARGGQVLVNGGNCALSDGTADFNWVHYLHAAYATPVAGTGLRPVWQRYKHARALRDERRGLARSRTVVANSQGTRAMLIEKLGVGAERVQVVYYGTDATQFAAVGAEERAAARAGLGWTQGEKAARPMALFVGALGDRRKGFDTLWEAWRRLCQRRDWDMGLAVAGRGAELAAWRERTRAAGLEERIQFLGFRTDIPRVLAASDVLIAPTRYEAYGLGVHEALARAIPALVSARAGVAERIPAGLASLLLEDPESVDELEGKLLEWRARGASLSPLIEELGGQLRAYSWDDMAADLLRGGGSA